ncbi:hypothetical protein [Microbulbifer yueqingensis]|uniref:Uncharacterized protein n=1 Tax=Microbulbifer yueqingensis TaxID=658219 RepID=A0A1G9EHC5_9GAMM|nr:hypothetical protein [Microbulbifer yueqingensis]SDK75550.1 hypothetical protein SAMN05216212_3130 [Microbulbifer yueqingensis]
MDERAFATLTGFLEQVPAVRGVNGQDADDDGCWWVKFDIDIGHHLAWQTVQELGHVLNYLSVNDRLPTCFYPVSPPPYMNGGPAEFLSWVIECNDPGFRPGNCAEWLAGRLPRPVGDLAQWDTDDEG